MRRSRLLFAVFIGACLLAACATPRMPPSVASTPIDLPRFMGRWYVIAYVPYFGERGHVASSDTYALQPNGGIDVVYRYRDGFGQPLQTLKSRATVEPGTGNRDWTTWIYGFIPTGFRILEVAPDYSWALITWPGRELAWVFARAPVMDDALYADLLQRLRGHGVETDAMRRIPQVPEQVGQPGFAAPDNP